jgi:hypothetical protein
MIHELRIYHCVPGRMPALLKRFETVALKLWKRHILPGTVTLDRTTDRWRTFGAGP